MKPGAEADRVLLAHMRDFLERIGEYTHFERTRFDTSRLVQDAVIRNLQTLAESSQRLSGEIKGTEPQIPWRELAGFGNVIVHGTRWHSRRYVHVGFRAARQLIRRPRAGMSEILSCVQSSSSRSFTALPLMRPPCRRCSTSGAMSSATAT